MVQTIQAQDISLEELQENFGLQLTTDSQFFRERYWSITLEDTAISGIGN